jgi:hypothetical protein
MAIKRLQTKSKAEVIACELDLRAKGCHLVRNKSKKDLLPYEYTKNEWSGTSKSFEGPIHYVISWHIPD